MSILTLYQTTTFWTGPLWKAFADEGQNVAELVIFVLDWVENTVGKREKVGTSIFSFSKQYFQKACLSRLSKL